MTIKDFLQHQINWHKNNVAKNMGDIIRDSLIWLYDQGHITEESFYAIWYKSENIELDNPILNTPVLGKGLRLLENGKVIHQI